MSFDRIDLEYIPKDIVTSKDERVSSVDVAASETRAVMEKLLAHAKSIKEWQDRIDGIKYLQDNAAKLAGNPVYIATDNETCRAVEVLGGKNGTIDFEMFKKCVDMVLEGYNQMALVALTGAK